MSKVIFVVGPTASGKSRLALEAAQKCDAEILNADSIQTYKTIQIGAAKATAEEQKLVPHHLINFVDEGDTYTAGKFRRDALKILENRFKSGVKKIYVVGGSGFYIQALIKGLYTIPEITPEVRESVKNTTKEILYQELQEKDPIYATKISANDTYRLQRSIEVIRHTKLPFSEYQNRFKSEDFPYKYNIVGLKVLKTNLVKRIELRTKKMLKEGLIQETQDLLNRGLKKWQPLSSVGYKEVVEFLEGALADKDLLPAIVRSTTALAKRQMTWFKRDKDIHWFDAEAQWDEALMMLED